MLVGSGLFEGNIGELFSTHWPHTHMYTLRVDVDIAIEPDQRVRCPRHCVLCCYRLLNDGVAIWVLNVSGPVIDYLMMVSPSGYWNVSGPVIDYLMMVSPSGTGMFRLSSYRLLNDGVAIWVLNVSGPVIDYLMMVSPSGY
ncbi:hypothetical protein Btru_032018 [Bulinus truncatus]|nr:hypothetical protein Btru_032018 [Bulinus truncatus]